MSKFSTPFVEIRLYLPLALDGEDIQKSPLYQALLANALDKENTNDSQK